VEVSLEIDAAEVFAALKALPTKCQNQAMTKALRAGSKEILPLARRNAPVESGRLKKSLKVTTLRQRTKGVKRLDVKTSKDNSLYQGDFFYGAFQEFGWKTGKRKGGGGVRRQIDGKHFLQNAYEAKGDAALKAVETTLVHWIKQYKGA
jgi:HK97 gp10 family phage protein